MTWTKMAGLHKVKSSSSPDFCHLPPHDEPHEGFAYSAARTDNQRPRCLGSATLESGTQTTAYTSAKITTSCSHHRRCSAFCRCSQLSTGFVGECGERCPLRASLVGEGRRCHLGLIGSWAVGLCDSVRYSFIFRLLLHIAVGQGRLRHRSWLALH